MHLRHRAWRGAERARDHQSAPAARRHPVGLQATGVLLGETDAPALPAPRCRRRPQTLPQADGTTPAAHARLDVVPAGRAPDAPVTIWLNPAHGPLRMQVIRTGLVTPVWCTSRRQDANTITGPLLGLPSVPYVDLPHPQITTSHPNGHLWKRDHVDTWLGNALAAANTTDSLRARRGAGGHGSALRGRRSWPQLCPCPRGKRFCDLRRCSGPPGCPEEARCPTGPRGALVGASPTADPPKRHGLFTIPPHM